MKLKSNFVTHAINGDHILVATGGSDFVGVVRSNATAAFIIESLKEQTSKKSIVEAMCLKYEAPRDVIETDVEGILEKLRMIGALDE